MGGQGDKKKKRYSPLTLNIVSEDPLVLLIFSLYCPESVFLKFVILRSPVCLSSCSLSLNASSELTQCEITPLESILILAIRTPFNFHSIESVLCISERSVYKVTESLSITDTVTVTVTVSPNTPAEKKKKQKQFQRHKTLGNYESCRMISANFL